MDSVYTSSRTRCVCASVSLSLYLSALQAHTQIVTVSKTDPRSKDEGTRPQDKTQWNKIKKKIIENNEPLDALFII